MLGWELALLRFSRRAAARVSTALTSSSNDSAGEGGVERGSTLDPAEALLDCDVDDGGVVGLALRVRCGDFGDFSTLPVVVFSFSTMPALLFTLQSLSLHA